jgi:hypothetical protein
MSTSGAVDQPITRRHIVAKDRVRTTISTARTATSCAAAVKIAVHLRTRLSTLTLHDDLHSPYGASPLSVNDLAEWRVS